MIKWLINSFRPNLFDKLLKQIANENKNRFLVVWNRGLGDIALGLYALVHRVKTFIPHASITFLTRLDLADAFSMLEGVQVLVCSKWERGKEWNIEKALKEHHLSTNMFDVVLEKPDPTKWFKWQLGNLTPKLNWRQQWDMLTQKYKLDPDITYIGAHVQTETGVFYDYEKNWDLASWRDLFKRINDEKKGKVLLFGMKKKPAFLMDNVIDLRGKTSVFEMLSLIVNHCRYLIAPDSGVLSLAYYVNKDFPIRVVSLWADPHQGVLRQKVASPNRKFEHIPLIGRNDNVANITVDTAYHALFS